MQIIITRSASQDSGTPGELLAINEAGKIFRCKTFELPWRDNQKSISCICSDSYPAIIWFSRRFRRQVLRLEDKNGRTDCLIHPGNFAGDSALGYKTDVQGCTLVGKSFGLLNNGNGQSQIAILDSRTTLQQLVQCIGSEPITVQYQWAEGCVPAS
ncbi:MAG: hypothetical protein HQM06_10515 [Magnetococcales bacterium]|nr:hypothetical protein [Magnetococcales bacterium]